MARQLQSWREAGSLTRLVICVNLMAQLLAWRGEFAAAASLVGEAEAIAAATGTRLLPYAALTLAAFRGAEAGAARVIEAAVLAQLEHGGPPT